MFKFQIEKHKLKLKFISKCKKFVLKFKNDDVNINEHSTKTFFNTSKTKSKSDEKKSTITKKIIKKFFYSKLQKRNEKNR